MAKEGELVETSEGRSMLDRCEPALKEQSYVGVVLDRPVPFGQLLNSVIRMPMRTVRTTFYLSRSALNESPGGIGQYLHYNIAVIFSQPAFFRKKICENQTYL